MPEEGRVTLTLNGTSVETEKGRLLIDVAEELGIFVPRFCYHPGMKPVAVCRMCLVKVEGQRKLLPACATPVDDGMTVDTVDPEAAEAQETMLEFLLINHPLDCPICDRGGECPLQDQTYRHGPGSSRYVEPKRTYEKALEISDLVVLDRERCVLCWRCVRFADEIAGDRFIQLVDRGPGTQILTFKDEPFDSYFSGNTIQICPVGALTAKPYRFVSRPWDLTTAPSVCAYCSVGCPITNEARADKLVRCQALPNENVNDFWNCDKGRFGYHYVESDERLEAPLTLKGEQFEVTSWGEALSLIAERLSGAKRVGVIAGGHLTTEDAFAISRLARGVIGTPHLDSRVQDAGAPYEASIALGVAGSTATIDDLDHASSIVWIGPDPKETLPVLYLRLRGAVLERGVTLVVISPRRISLDEFATSTVRCDPGSEARALSQLERDVLGDSAVFCWGPSSPGRDESAALEAIVEVAAAIEGRLLVCPPHAGSQGMIDMGVHPRLEPGYRVASDEGMDTRAILEAAAAKELDALLVFGADLIGDFPDSQLAHRAFESGVFTIVVELFPTETAVRADVVLPSSAYAEREGTFANLERRLQKLESLLPPPVGASEPWRICAQLASALGEDWGWNNVDDVWATIRDEVPTHSSVDLAAIVQSIPPTTLVYESPFEAHPGPRAVAGPGGQYPKGYRQGAPFQTGQNWPLSWELRAFEATQRPGLIPPLPERAAGGTAPSSPESFKGSSGAVPSSPTQGEDAQPGAARASPDSSPSFQLLSGRLIYDEGAMVAKSAALRGIARRPFVEMNDEDARELGVADGDDVVLASGATEARLPVVIADIARGAVFVPYDQAGLPANTLMSGVDPTVEVRKP